MLDSTGLEKQIMTEFVLQEELTVDILLAAEAVLKISTYLQMRISALPKFYNSWCSFWDLFLNIVGNHGNIKKTILVRPDRDEYVTINWENIKEEDKCKLWMFQKEPFGTF